MIKNYIILTPKKLTWPNLKRNRIYVSTEDVIENFTNYNILKRNAYFQNHRWINKKILRQDLKYIYYLNKKIIKHIYKKLNKIHKTKYSEKFWFILISPWSLIFLQIYFDRWNSIKSILNKKKGKFFVNSIIYNKPEILTPLDTKEFLYFFRHDDWNQFIGQKILNFNKKKVIIKNHKYNFSENNLKNNKNFSSPNQSFLNKLVFFIFGLFNRKKYNYFLYKTYLGFWKELLLSLKLGQLPIFEEFNLKIKNKKLNFKIRNDIKKHIPNSNAFENTLTQIFAEQMPIIFLEKFNELENFVNKKCNLPRYPKKIFSSSSLWGDTVINYYIAKSLEKNTKLYYSQHGGTYGIAQTHFQTEYETNLAHKYLTWGWKNKNKKNIISFGIIKNLKHFKANQNNNGNLLLMVNKRHKYTTLLNSSLNEGIDYIKYLKFYSKFLFNLKKDIKNETVIRHQPGSNFQENADFFGHIDKNFKVDNSESLQNAFKASKIVVHTLNSTSIIESLFYNIPTVIILDKKKNPLTPQGEKTFKFLKKNKIFFDNPNKAAKFINEIWNSKINDWWLSNNTQNAVRNFKANFARKKIDVVTDLKNMLSN